MTLRTDALTQSLPQKGSTMAKKQAAAPVPHHHAVGQAAHAAMTNLNQTGAQHATGNEMAFGGVLADQQDFTPRNYKSKSNKEG